MRSRIALRHVAETGQASRIAPRDGVSTIFGAEATEHDEEFGRRRERVCRAVRRTHRGEPPTPEDSQ